MKKTIGKPDNWQDFEKLCKKLWGEIWQIPNTIKQNGRIGQVQHGVDIYGIPKGSKNYFGIQCKGKDDYINAKLTTKEIDKEIDNAKRFSPNLEQYIIATTANKDARIEEYVRKKNIENSKDSFEIHLFCWEDIVDLLEEYNDTYYWYLNGISQKDKYDFTISFNDFCQDLVLKPTFLKKINTYLLSEKNTTEFLEKFELLPLKKFNMPNVLFGYSNEVNKSWCDFDIVLENTGSKVIEDWQFRIKFTEGVRQIFDEYSQPFRIITPSKFRSVYVADDKKSLNFYPYDNMPLIQKNNKFFKISVLPEHNCSLIKAEWELLARDFSVSGNLLISVQPNYIESNNCIEVSCVENLLADEIIICDYITEKESLK